MAYIFVCLPRSSVMSWGELRLDHQLDRNVTAGNLITGVMVYVYVPAPLLSFHISGMLLPSSNPNYPTYWMKSAAVCPGEQVFRTVGMNKNAAVHETLPHETPVACNKNDRLNRHYLRSTGAGIITTGPGCITTPDNCTTVRVDMPAYFTDGLEVFPLLAYRKLSGGYTSFRTKFRIIDPHTVEVGMCSYGRGLGKSGCREGSGRLSHA